MLLWLKTKQDKTKVRQLQCSGTPHEVMYEAHSLSTSTLWLWGVAEEGEQGRESNATSLMLSSPEFSERRKSSGGRLPDTVLTRLLPHFSSVPRRMVWADSLANQSESPVSNPAVYSTHAIQANVNVYQEFSINIHTEVFALKSSTLQQNIKPWHFLLSERVLFRTEFLSKCYIKSHSHQNQLKLRSICNKHQIRFMRSKT